VREALRWLEADGLLTREGPKNLHVAPMSRRDLDQVYACRCPLEGLAAAEAATSRTDEHLTRLRTIYDQLLAAQATHSVQDYFLGNVAFTDAVHMTSGNATLIRLLRGLGKQALRYRYNAYKLFPELIVFSVDGSCRIIAAIVDRDAEAAKRITQELIDRSWMTIRGCFDA
jgi:DNA-binding GntR family transcriptional regulator